MHIQFQNEDQPDNSSYYKRDFYPKEKTIQKGNIVEGIDSRVVVGVHSLSGGEEEIDIEIEDVEVGDGGMAAVSVTRGLDLGVSFAESG